MQTLRTLQVGRGLAALSVAAYHLTVLLSFPRYLGTGIFERWTARGYLGVDFFFVLSGFIIIYIHHGDVGRPAGFGPYAVKRLVRLYPIYWLYSTVLVILLALHVGEAAALPSGWRDWVSTYFLIRLTNANPPIGAAWTLFHEVFFYALFGLAILNRRLGLAVAAVLILATLWFFNYSDGDQRTPFNDYLSAWNLDFVLGIGAYFLIARIGALTARLLCLGGAVGFIALLWLDTSGVAFVAYPLLYALCFAALLSGCVHWEQSRATAPSLWLLALLGDASYSLYLTHQIFESVFAKIVLKLAGGGAIDPHILYLVILGATAAAGCLVYLGIERPLLARLRSRSGRPADRSPS